MKTRPRVWSIEYWQYYIFAMVVRMAITIAINIGVIMVMAMVIITILWL